jgi:hypothetical protein
MESESDFDSDDECNHTEIENNCCLECGFIFEKFHNSVRSYNKKNINFEKELLNLNIPLEIKQWVIRKSALSKKKITRMSCRKQILFAYLYLAYLDLKYIDFKPEYLITILNITKKNSVGISLKYVSGIASSLLPQGNEDIITASLVIISPVIYIEEIMNKLDMLELKNVIILYCENLLKDNDLLYEENPELMATAIVKYYLDSNNIKIVKYYQIFKKNQTVIKNIIKTFFTKCRKDLKC